MGRKPYRVGVDVGDRSVGLAAIEIDLKQEYPSMRDIRDAPPKKILNAVSYIHDGAVYDPKKASTRKEIAGMVRRARRRLKTRRKRLNRLNDLLKDKGYPVDLAREMAANMPKGESPLFQWEIRSRAAGRFIENDQERMLALTIAILHIARHRGWRNPYASFESLERLSEAPSDFYKDLLGRVMGWLDASEIPIPPSFGEAGDARPTPAQLMFELMRHDPTMRIRGNGDAEGAGNAVPMSKLHQSDYYAELLRIFEAQGVDRECALPILRAVFFQVSPRDVAAAAQLVGKDDLQPSHPRASRASMAFQEFRILSTIANLQVMDGAEKRFLDAGERGKLLDLLRSPRAAKGDVDWNDVADCLGVSRSALKGVGGETEDGEPISAKQPPSLRTEHALGALAKVSRRFKGWWGAASSEQKELFVMSLDNAGIPDYFEERYPEALDEVAELIESFDDETLAKIDALDLEAGRAAYGIDTLRRLNERMLGGMNLHEARKAEFGVGDDWKPSPAPLGTLVGNGAADCVIKIVSRWLRACEKKWGPPLIVNIEHVREGFKSVKTARKFQQEQQRRYQKNQQTREELGRSVAAQAADALNASCHDRSAVRTEVRQSDIRKQQAIERQNGRCLYCGTPITLNDAEMDHIVPRKQWGASNSIYNLVAVCRSCNHSKSNTLYSAWASSEEMDETIERVKQLTRSAYFSPGEFARYKKEVMSRLRQTEEDEDIDERSFESIAWMARALRRQIEGYLRSGAKSVLADALFDEGDNEEVYGDDSQRASIVCADGQRVFVYQGWVTATARRLGGIEKALPWIGGATEKDRLDRRHHAVDAAVIALMNPGVAQILALRNELRRTAFDREGSRELGFSSVSDQLSEHPLSRRFEAWRTKQMAQLKQLLEDRMKKDGVPVLRLKRLRLDDGDAHAQTVYKAAKRKVGDALSATAINKASSVALWMALTNHPDYDAASGLPADPSRKIRVRGTWLGPNDDVSFLAPCSDNGDKLEADDGVAYKAIRGGLVQLGEAIHHTRIYRLAPTRPTGQPKYYQMRVYQADLLLAKGDLFAYELPASSYSRRFALSKLRDALSDGAAEYIGWLTINDEIQIDPHLFRSGTIGAFLSIPDFSDTARFVLTGYESNYQLKLRPAGIAAEGLEGYIERHPDLTDDQLSALKTIVEVKGWRVSVNDLMASCPRILRRSTLGYVRWGSRNHMPESWSPGPDSPKSV